MKNFKNKGIREKTRNYREDKKLQVILESKGK